MEAICIYGEVDCLILYSSFFKRKILHFCLLSLSCIFFFLHLFASFAATEELSWLALCLFLLPLPQVVLTGGKEFEQLSSSSPCGIGSGSLVADAHNFCLFCGGHTRQFSGLSMTLCSRIISRELGDYMECRGLNLHQPHARQISELLYYHSCP